jgi:hypothetical protein
MNTSLRILVCLALLSVACDDKKGGPTSAASASASTVATPTTAAPSTTTSAAASVATPTAATSAAPSASSGTSMITGDAKDVVLTVKDPAKEPEKTIKAQAGGSVTLFLPDFPGTAWGVGESDKSLGKAKEEVIPGFAPGTNGHQFKWATNGPLLKAGQKHKVQLVNKKAGDKAAKPNSTFTLTIEIT